MSQKLFSYG